MSDGNPGSKPGRDEVYDSLLREMNDWLAPVEEQLTADLSAPRRPVTFIVGPPRSGTTLLTQVLAVTDAFAYPSNLIARFYGNLALGGRVQRVLQAVLPREELQFVSDFGRTREWWAPSEFGFFWERHFPLDDCHELDEEQLARSDTDRFRRELAAFEAETGRPVFMKATLLTYSLPYLHQLLPNAVFVRVTRCAWQVVQSLLLLRKRLFGSFESWFSIKPRNWRELAELRDPVEQVVAQICTVERSLNDAFSRIPGANTVTVDYEAFCHDTRGEIRKLESALAAWDCAVDIADRAPLSFPMSRSQELDDEMHRRVLIMCEKYGLD